MVYNFNPLEDIFEVPSATKYFSTICRNNTGVTIPKRSVVYISGALGNKALISLSQANSEMTSSKTLGVTLTDIADNSTGEVVVLGELKGVNTSMFADGNSLWLSPTIAGGLTATKPTAPNHAVFIGTVIYAHNVNGIIEINIQNGYELDELHDVLISSPSDGQSLTRDGSLWVNKFSWGFLVEHWDSAPTLNKNITGGAVYNYTYRGVTRYRFVPTTYSASSDAFYTNFNSSTDALSGLIVSRGV